MPRIAKVAPPLIEAGYQLSPSQLYSLLAIPEVAAIAVPGESVMGVVAERNHFLVQFWPEVVQRPLYSYSYGAKAQSTEPVWCMTPPMLYDIDTKAKADRPVSTFEKDGNDHWTAVVHAAPGYKHCRVHSGQKLCRGDAWFSNDPSQCVVALRHWTIQTHNTDDDRYLSCGCAGAYGGHAWWKQHMDEFLATYKEPRVVLVPGGNPYIPYAKLVVFDKDKVKALGESVGSLPGLYTEEGVEKVPEKFVSSSAMPQGLPS